MHRLGSTHGRGPCITSNSVVLATCTMLDLAVFTLRLTWANAWSLPCVEAKRCKIGPYMYTLTNRKPYAANSIMTFSMTLDDLERLQVKVKVQKCTKYAFTSTFLDMWTYFRHKQVILGHFHTFSFLAWLYVITWLFSVVIQLLCYICTLYLVCDMMWPWEGQGQGQKCLYCGVLSYARNLFLGAYCYLGQDLLNAPFDVQISLSVGELQAPKVCENRCFRRFWRAIAQQPEAAFAIWKLHSTQLVAFWKGLVHLKALSPRGLAQFVVDFGQKIFEAISSSRPTLG